MGVFGDGARPPPALEGFPDLCGNANPLRTLSWMAPANFNASTERNPRAVASLARPAPDAPVFVVGCGHSGTTELITLLDRHPLVHAYLDGPGAGARMAAAGAAAGGGLK